MLPQLPKLEGVDVTPSLVCLRSFLQRASKHLPPRLTLSFLGHVFLLFRQVKTCKEAFSEGGSAGVDRQLQIQHVLNTVQIRHAHHRRGWVFVRRDGGLSHGYTSPDEAAEAVLRLMSASNDSTFPEVALIAGSRKRKLRTATPAARRSKRAR